MTRVGDILKIRQGDTEPLWVFVAKFHKERAQLLMVPDNCPTVAFLKGLNPKCSIASFKLRKSMKKFKMHPGMKHALDTNT